MLYAVQRDHTYLCVTPGPQMINELLLLRDPLWVKRWLRNRPQRLFVAAQGFRVGRRALTLDTALCVVNRLVVFVPLGLKVTHVHLAHGVFHYWESCCVSDARHLRSPPRFEQPGGLCGVFYYSAPASPQDP